MRMLAAVRLGMDRALADQAAALQRLPELFGKSNAIVSAEGRFGGKARGPGEQQRQPHDKSSHTHIQ
jgi:hypothetical protein